MSIIVRPTKTANIAPIPGGTLSKVKTELEKQNIKFISKYTTTQALRKFGLDEFNEIRHKYQDFISKYGFCLIEAYGNADDLRKLGISFYVEPKPIQSTPLDEAKAKLGLFYELKDCMDDSIEKGYPNDQIAEEMSMLFDLQDELNKKIDDAIIYCNHSKDYISSEFLKEEKDTINTYLEQLLKNMN